MKALLPILIFLAIVTSANAQFGISAKYQNNKASGWESTYDELSPSSIEYGINYWLRLKNKRVEFLPELTYASSKSSFEDRDFATELSQFNRTSYGFGVNTHIYPLDFEGDCNCPTFSKDGNIVSKGFHWIINTAVINHSVETIFVEPADSFSVPFEDKNQITFRAGLGIGLDIGITELFTLVPHALYSRNFGLDSPTVTLNGLLIEQSNSIQSSLNQLHFGLRLVFRPDYIKQNGGFRRR